MSIKRILFNKTCDLIISLIGLNRPIRLYRAFLARINAVQTVVIHGTKLIFDANEELHLLRANLLETKEPETLAWIDSFDNGDTLFDIGANVGVFSLYAALHRNCDVFAFEPESKNYACLNQNIYLNNASEQIKALNLGLHDRTCIEYLRLNNLESGSALHSLGEAIDWRKEAYISKFNQAVLAFSLDEFIETFATKIPNHIKLDVDGNELKIIHGAQKTLSNSTLKSILVELNINDKNLIEAIESCGLKMAEKTLAAFQGTHTDTYNVVFRRE